MCTYRFTQINKCNKKLKKGVMITVLVTCLVAVTDYWKVQPKEGLILAHRGCEVAGHSEETET